MNKPPSIQRPTSTKKSVGRAPLAPQLIEIRLDQIKISRSPDLLAWTDHCPHLTAATPTLKPDAMEIIQIVNPLVVTQLPGVEAYQLIAGRRTFQLLVENASLGTKVRAILLAKPDLAQQFTLFDCLIQRIINAPSDSAISTIAAQLVDDKPLRERLAPYLKLDAQLDICRLFNMSRTTLHRRIAAARPNLSGKVNLLPGSALTLL